MPFKTEILPDLPVIIRTHVPGDEDPDLLVASMKKFMGQIEEQPRRVYIVLDVRTLSMDLDTMLKVSSSAAHGPAAFLHHPNVIETLFIVSNTFMKLGAMGLRSEAYGSANVSTFETLAQAMNYCRAKIGEGAHS